MGGLNYFNCTLGEAESLNQKNPPQWSTVAGLLDYRATKNGGDPAIGFPCAPNEVNAFWGGTIYSKLSLSY